MDKISKANDLLKQAVDLLNPTSSTCTSSRDADRTRSGSVETPSPRLLLLHRVQGEKIKFNKVPYI